MRIFIASSDRMLRLALLLLIEDEPGMAVTGMFDQAEGLSTIADVSKSDVYVLDDALTQRTSIADLIGAVHQLESSPKIIVLSIDPEIESIALAAGADFFISKTLPPDDLLPILRQMNYSMGTA